MHVRVEAGHRGQGRRAAQVRAGLGDRHTGLHDEKSEKSPAIN